MFGYMVYIYNSRRLPVCSRAFCIQIKSWA